MVLTCAITGHRPEKFYFKSERGIRCINLKEQIRVALELLYKSGYTRFIVGGAREVDMWASEILLELQKKYKAIEIYCIFPFLQYTEKWVSSDLERQKAILKKITGFRFLSEHYTKDCYKKRNYEMVDRSQILLAVCDTDNPRSGTMQTVRYARKKHLNTISIDFKTFEIYIANNLCYK